MSKYSLRAVITVLIFACKKTDSVIDSTPQIEEIRPLDIANKLKQWSVNQPDPFVIFNMGDTTNGRLNDYGDVVTNIVYEQYDIFGKRIDSLVIDSSSARFLIGGNRSKEELKTFYDAIDISFEEEKMVFLLHAYNLKLRMMHYDSVTYDLNIKLLEWAKHQYPPKTIWAGMYSLINEMPNSGGYSTPMFTFRGVQNLQYFTRSVDSAIVQNIVSTVDTSLTSGQLKRIMEPVADIQFYDTQYGDE
ncbi:MAG TPA: hypothetical protein ENK44_06025 [Caldithrix abyssi]|uniref:Uncharacterized protein n=1 Tax=Caldithrix abyssi TaxID=187145 RepID=A0A7V4WUE1_CALAY|nr:hypothetical protein [Caldithrix abyssi]